MKKSIHLWAITFHSQMNKLAEFSTYLSNDEIQRSNAFVFKYLHDQFIVSRGFLRYILSQHLKIHPKKIDFSYSEYGKPEIGTSHKSPIQFNLSHSNEYFVIAIAHDLPIGLDIEYCNPSLDILEIAKEVFSPLEIAKLAFLTKENARKEFFRMWTIKEAYIKAIGKGFSFNPKWIEIDDVANNFHATHIAKEVDLKNWYFSEHDLDSNYSLSLVSYYEKPHVIFHHSCAR